MNIQMTDDVAILLEATTAGVNGLEFSGFGFVTQIENTLVIYDFEILNVGSVGFTEIQAKDIAKLATRDDRQNLRCWIHRHPLGNGIPGPHNWSGVDNATIKEEPLGGPPELIGWSCSIVRTPKGWVGRVDNYKSGKTVHVPVLPEIHQKVLARPWEHLYREQLKRRAVEEYQSNRNYFTSTQYRRRTEGNWGKYGTGLTRLSDSSTVLPPSGTECEVCGNEGDWLDMAYCEVCDSSVCQHCSEEWGDGVVTCSNCVENNVCAECDSIADVMYECHYCGGKVCPACINQIKGELICLSCQPELISKGRLNGTHA